MAFQTNTSSTKFLFFTIFFLISLQLSLNPCLCQQQSANSNSQNIEIIYPFFPPSPSSASPSLPPTPNPPLTPNTPPPKSRPHKTSKKAIATAVGVTAASTLVVAGLLFFLCTKYAGHQKKEPRVNPYAAGAVGGVAGAVAAGGGGGRLQPVAQTEFTRFDGNIKGLIVDEDGLDVLYWRKLEGSQRKSSGPFHKEVFSSHNKPPSGKRNFSRGKSSTSSNPKEDQNVKLLDQKQNSSDRNHAAAGVLAADHGVSEVVQRIQGNVEHAVSRRMSAVGSQRLANEAQEVQTSAAVAGAVPAPAPAPRAPPPPPPPVPVKKGPAAPPPPPPPGKKGPGPPPPPPVRTGASSAPKPPQAPKRSPSGNVVELSAIGEDATDDKNEQVKLKPLHWEKVNVVDRGHSMVWDKLERGSFQYNGDMMEALFGYVATNRKSPKESNSAAQDSSALAPAAKIFVLDSRRSQNIAIVIRSLGISRQELIDGLLEGRGLNVDILEKLTRMAPTREEKILLLAFDGDVGRLADAESFLYHLLKAVPSAFTRVNAMLFRYTYGSELQQLKDSLETLDTACSELRNRGVFLKLLEAILKAGNRLNAGTTRGDAKAFNLTALRKLSDYKSSDGKTTLLHFVVHEVVRNEGRRCVMNRNNGLNRSNSQKNSGSSMGSDESKSKEEQEKEFLKLGLPVVGGLSSEFTNVKKAATIDYDTLTEICKSLGTRISETRQLVLQCGADGGGGEFIKEMKEFLGSAEGEIKAVQEEQQKVLELVKKTTQYYQSGAFKDKHPLQMFVIVKDFLSMVDKTCIDITRSLQQKKSNTGAAAAGSSASPSSAPNPDVLRTRVTFPRLPDHFLSDKTNASDSDDDH